MSIIIVTKRCARCSETKPVDGFYARRGNGLSSWCRACTCQHLREKHAATRADADLSAAHTAAKAALYRQRIAADPDYRARRNAQDRAAYAEMTPEQRAARVAYNREWQRRYYAENEDFRARRLTQVHARRAAETQGDAEVFDRWEIYDRDQGVCHICRKKIRRRDFQIDHLRPLTPPPGEEPGAHTRANVAAAHSWCNARRHNGRLAAQLRMIG